MAQHMQLLRPYGPSLLTPAQPGVPAFSVRTDPGLRQSPCSTITVRSFEAGRTQASAQESTSQPSTAAEQGQISQEIVERMKLSITEALQAESVEIADTYGDGRHVSINVVASAFEGKNSVKRQQAVYKAIWLELQDTVHAVDSMTTKTPSEAGS